MHAGSFESTKEATLASSSLASSGHSGNILGIKTHFICHFMSLLNAFPLKFAQDHVPINLGSALFRFLMQY